MTSSGDFMTAPEGVVGLDYQGRRTVLAKDQYRLIHTAWSTDEVNGRRFPTTSQTAEFTGRIWEKDEAGRWRLLTSFGGTGFKEYTTVSSR